MNYNSCTVPEAGSSISDLPTDSVDLVSRFLSTFSELNQFILLIISIFVSFFILLFTQLTTLSFAVSKILIQHFRIAKSHGCQIGSLFLG